MILGMILGELTVQDTALVHAEYISLFTGSKLDENKVPYSR